MLLTQIGGQESEMCQQRCWPCLQGIKFSDFVQAIIQIVTLKWVYGQLRKDYRQAVLGFVKEAHHDDKRTPDQHVSCNCQTCVDAIQSTTEAQQQSRNDIEHGRQPPSNGATQSTKPCQCCTQAGKNIREYLKNLWTAFSLVNGLLVASTITPFSQAATQAGTYAALNYTSIMPHEACWGTLIPCAYHHREFGIVWSATLALNCFALACSVLMLGYMLAVTDCSMVNWVLNYHNFTGIPALMTIIGTLAFLGAVIWTASEYYHTVALLAVGALAAVFVVLSFAGAYCIQILTESFGSIPWRKLVGQSGQSQTASSTSGQQKQDYRSSAGTNADSGQSGRDSTSFRDQQRESSQLRGMQEQQSTNQDSKEECNLLAHTVSGQPRTEEEIQAERKADKAAAPEATETAAATTRPSGKPERKPSGRVDRLLPLKAALAIVSKQSWYKRMLQIPFRPAKCSSQAEHPR